MSCVISITAALEQNKVSNSEIVEKVIPVANFLTSDDMYQKL